MAKDFIARIVFFCVNDIAYSDLYHMHMVQIYSTNKGNWVKFLFSENFRPYSTSTHNTIQDSTSSSGVRPDILFPHIAGIIDTMLPALEK